MDGSNLASDQVIAELVGMGFDISKVTEAIKEVGPSLDSAIEFLLNGCHKKSSVASSSSKYSSNSEKVAGKRVLSSSHSFGRMRQSSLLDHLQSAGRPKIQRTTFMSGVSVSEAKILPKHVEVSFTPFHCKEEDNGPDWEHKANMLLHKHFGYSSLKGFQKEALAAWVAHKDCLVLAATGSGKSLCFQIPALLTDKVVVVISPLISLMHDQCLKLAKHGVSACFLGSGQIDSSVEQKAMNGMYAIIYVCPETVLRLMAPLQGLAESRGIALFAIDEVHCVSKWGHDFRPDYRRLSVLRENFKADNLKFLKFDIPVMALTATATIQVREDILKSLHMSKESKIVLTSFFRPNLRFLVKHSRTSSPSYETDFQELIDVYTRNQVTTKKHKFISQGMKDASDASDNRSSMSFGGTSERDGIFKNNVLDDIEDDYSSESGSHLLASQGEKLSVEYLEDECDLLQDVDDFDVSCGEFYGQTPRNDWNACASSEAIDMASTPEERIELMKGPLEHGSEAIDMASTPEERIELMKGPLEHGSTIIYVCTRKETLSIAKFLCRCGVKAAAYNAKLPKSHLRQVHKEFHENTVEVVVATIAFGMGIDKSNVRRIYHYGWPQSLEAYYQEAGRAGRDGKLADCVLYANLLRKPSLLPSKRSEEQTKQAYRMLSDCFRYGIHTSICRAKALVQYFGEDFSREKCLICDVCVEGPPEMQNLMDEAQTFVRVIAAHHGQSSFLEGSYDDNSYHGNRRDRVPQKPNIKMFVSKIREQLQKFTTTDHLWWQGLARILEDKGFIREGDDRIHVQIKFPEPTKWGLEFLQTNSEEPFYVYPEADMLLSMSTQKPYSSFAEWGKGWADPEIRKQRLERKKQSWRSPRKRKSRKRQQDLKTVRGRLAAKFSK